MEMGLYLLNFMELCIEWVLEGGWLKYTVGGCPDES